MPLEFKTEEERSAFFSRIAKKSNKKGQQSGFAARPDLASKYGRIGGLKNKKIRVRDEKGRFI